MFEVPFWILTLSHSEFLQKVLLATPILLQIIDNEMKVYKIFEGRLSLSSSYYAFENYLNMKSKLTKYFLQFQSLLNMFGSESYL